MAVDQTCESEDLESFTSLGVIDLLQADARPTFVVLAHFDEQSSIERLHPVFSNTALNEHVGLKKHLFGDAAKSPMLNAFILWMHTALQSPGSTYSFFNTEWCCTMIANKWFVVGAIRVGLQPQTIDSYKPAMPTSLLDWTQMDVPTQCPEYVEYLRNLDWSSTSVGPMSTWSSELRIFFNLIMRTDVAQVLYWGDDLTTIYNPGFIPITGGKHPTLLGKPCRVGWSEDWNYFQGFFEQMRRTGTAIEIEQCMTLQRSGFIEEVYFDYTHTPIVGSHGAILGSYAVVRETTKTLLAKRRLATTTIIHQQMSIESDVDDLCRRFLDALGSNKRDIAFATVYTQDTIGFNTISDSKSDQRPQEIFWKGSVGLSDGLLPPTIDVESTSSPFNSLLQTAHALHHHVVLRKDDNDLNGITSEALLPEYGHGAGFEQAVLYPLRIARGDCFFGFLLVGLSTRCLFDEVYEQYVTSAGERLNDALATTLLRQMELREQQKHSDLKQSTLEESLVEQRRQAKVMEQRFTRLTAASPAAVCIAKVDGTITYANEMFHTIFGFGEDWQLSSSWMTKILEEDRPATKHMWQGLVASGTVSNYEYRVKKPWIHPASKEICLPHTWCMGNAYPIIAEDGVTEYVTTSVDISLQKWIQQESQSRTEEVLEAKRQQDAFTDMVAHEIRNPLNAIMQSADMIRASIEDLHDEQIHSVLVNEVIENAQTITHCTLHQKKIIDDLLVLSKLDSDLLSFTPVISRPTVILDEIVGMFKIDANAHEIVLTSEVHPSLEQNRIIWAMLDPQRVSQVLVNLVTNAIKFTKGCVTRYVKIQLEAATDPLYFRHNYGFEFFPTNRVRPRTEFTSEDVFLLFSVTDSGPGISSEAQSQLFRRFSQEHSLRTHIVYGGSGLGLWISRELTEMQGGEIGLKTNPEGGTTFAFYVRTRAISPSSELEASTIPIGLSNEVREAKGLEADEPQIGQHKLDSYLKSLTVLLTEDNLINQRVMKKQLQKIFRKILIANHGGEAIDLVKESQIWRDNTKSMVKAPDLIFMDIEMPVLNGVDCTRKIREFEAQGQIIDRIPIIAITANARSEQVTEYREVGMDDVLSKPFVIRDLVHMVARLQQDKY